MDINQKILDLRSWSVPLQESSIDGSLFHLGLLSFLGISGAREELEHRAVRQGSFSDRELLGMIAALHSRNSWPSPTFSALVTLAVCCSNSLFLKMLYRFSRTRSSAGTTLLGIYLLTTCLLSHCETKAHDAAIAAFILRRSGSRLFGTLVGRLLSFRFPNNLLFRTLAEESVDEIMCAFWARVPWEQPDIQDWWMLEHSTTPFDWEHSCCWDYIFLIHLIGETYGLSLEEPVPTMS